MVERGCPNLWRLASFYGERSKVQRVRLALSCRPWDYLLETVDAFKYLKGILLLCFYPDCTLNLAEATKPMVLFGMVYVPAEGIVRQEDM